MINRLMKINLRVRSMENATQLMTELLGGQVIFERGANTLGDYESRLFQVADVTFDVGIPANEDSDLAKTIDKLGEGIDSICFAVDDVSEVGRQLESQGVHFVYEAEYDGSRIAFTHPKDACGVKLEFMDGPTANPT
ncbi:MAG: VOC family protein [Chloroflexota bacterium]|nr:VOC family protein [Chloroflexota bacterium]